MSEENEQGEEKPKDDLAGSDEFEFYFSFTKPLVLDLPSSEDRAIAAAWVQKLEAEPESEEEKQLRLNYLKLLLFVLQRGRLSGIFKKQPPSGPLQPFPQGFSIIDMGNWMLDQDDGQPCGGGDARSAPYTIEISNDLREFVASQEIPNFGIQMYYAWSSDDPIHKWASFDEEKFPQFILDKIKQLKEIKSDERSSIGKNGCPMKKKGCDLNLPDKYSKKKVKSPQEIERSQGRSFHTYMGLVGRMGNFNDKCDDDPDKFQRQDPRKMKCQRRSPQKRCPGNGGEDDMMPEEDYDNLVSGLGGLSTQGKSCQCAYPCQHENNPDNTKGGPQAFDPQQSPGRNGYNMRGDVDPNSCPPGGSKPTPPRRPIEELCPDFQTGQIGPPQRNNACRSRSGSPNRPQECPAEDKGRGFPEQTGVCICSKPPCTCPCPRGSPPKGTPNANSGNAGGRASPETNRCPVKSPKQDLCGPEGYGSRGAPNYNAPNKPQDSCPPMGGSEGYGGRGAPNYNAPIRAQDACAPMGGAESYGGRGAPNYNGPNKAQDSCAPMGGPEGYGGRGAPNYNGPNKAQDSCAPMGPPSGGACGRQGSPNMRSGQTEVMHCYNPRNPDPTLYDKMDNGWADMGRECGNKNLPSPQSNKMPACRRGLFSSMTQSTPAVQEPLGPSEAQRNGGRYCPANARIPPPVQPQQQPGQCDYSAQDDQNANYQVGNQPPLSFLTPPLFLDSKGEPISPITAPNESYGQRPKQDACRRSPSQGMSRPKTCAGAQGGNENSRMGNMNNALQGMKQRTDAQKCDAGAARRSPSTDAGYYPGNAQAQAKPTGKPRPQMVFDNGAMAQNGQSCQPRNARQGQQMFPQQAKQAPQCGPSQERGYVNLPNSPQMKQGMPQQQQPAQQRQQMRSPAVAPAGPECYLNNQSAFQDYEFQEDDLCEADLAAYDSLEACRPQSPLTPPQQSMGRSMQQGMQQGMPQGMQQGMQQGMPQGMQQCMPQGMQQGMPQGMQQGMPQGMQQGMPQGMQQGMPQGMPQGMQQCMPQGMQQGMPQGMQQGMPQGMQQGAPQGMPQGMQQPPPIISIEECGRSMAPAPFSAPSDAPYNPDGSGPQWVSVRGIPQDPFGSPMQGGPYQGELGDVEGRCMRPQRSQPQSSGPSRSCARTSPPRTSPGRTSPPRNGSPRGGPGAANAQDAQAPCAGAPDMSMSIHNWSMRANTSGTPASQDMPSCFGSPDLNKSNWPGRTQANGSPNMQNMSGTPDTSRANWSNRVQPAGAPASQDMSPCFGSPDLNKSFWPGRAQGNGSPKDYESVNWASPKAVKYLKLPNPDAGSCAPPPSPATNMACPRQNAPSQQQRSAPNYPNYPQQTMNAEPQFPEDQCADDMAEDMDNMDMNDMDQQTYTFQDEMCEDDGEGAYGEEDNQACETQNFMPMKSNLDGGEEGYDDYQDMNDCDPMPPPQNPPMNRSGGGQRNSGSQGQRSCSRPPPTNNRNSSDQCPAGMASIRR